MNLGFSLKDHQDKTLIRSARNEFHCTVANVATSVVNVLPMTPPIYDSELLTKDTHRYPHHNITTVTEPWRRVQADRNQHPLDTRIPFDPNRRENESMYNTV